MPESIGASLNVDPNDWQTLIRQLNYTFQDIYAKLDHALQYRGGITVKLEYGGLGQDASTFNGLVEIAGGKSLALAIGEGLQILNNSLTVKLTPGGGLSVDGTGISGVLTGTIGFQPPTSAALVAGVLTLTDSNKFHSYKVDGGGGSADLTSIVGANLTVGDLVMLRAETAGHVVVVKNSASLILQKMDFTLDSVNDRMILVCDDTTSNIWSELHRSNNG